MLLLLLLAVAAEQPWQLLGEGYQLTADSAVDRQGNVYFTDARTNRILKIDLDGKIATWRENSNGAHGIAFHPKDGRLYAGQHDLKRIVAYSMAGEESEAFADAQTHHLTVTSRGAIYYTQAPAHRVWIADSFGERLVHEGLQWPRGVQASADGSRLYVGDSRANSIWRFRIERDGSLAGGRPFCMLKTSAKFPEADAGGMALDSKGFLYVATQLGVQVCDKRGQVTKIIDVPGTEGASNVYFAGPGLRWMYVVEWDKLYRRPH
ncbi:MAG: SMP-30/gluconolactonase/LRE family protein [Acidobacteria bacterium]|nr:SMP-30/gluconolactonase/LRE family protein [Acidobacteriota bacterium]